MLRIFSRAEDIKSAKFPDLTWDGAADARSLEALRDYVIAWAGGAETWYLRKRIWKRRGGLLTRLLAMLCTAVGGAMPVVLQAHPGPDGKPWFSPAWASVVLGMAALFVGLDYFLGFTSGWMRYVQAQQKIAGIVQAFQFDWETLRAGWGANPSREQVLAALGRLKDIALQVEKVVQDETDAWIAEFKSTLKLLDDAARAKAEAAPLPGANVVVTNGDQVAGEWTLTVDDGAATRHRGQRAAQVGLQPGAHKFAVEGQMGNDRKRDEVTAVVPASGVAEVSLTLR
jgi:hypothetical protein